MMVQLEQFVAETLLQILRGVREAQAGARSLGAVVNPTELSFRPDQLQGRGCTSDNNVAQNVEFDVAVTTSEDDAKKVGVGVLVAAFGLGGQREHRVNSESLSRIRFMVPILFPSGGGGAGAA